MAGLKKSAKAPSRKRVSVSPKAQQPAKPFLSAEFVHDTSDEELEQSSSGSERSPNLASKKAVTTPRAQIEAPILSAKPKAARLIEKDSKKQNSKSPSRSDSGSSASQSGKDDGTGSGSGTGSESESEREIEKIGKCTAQAPKQQKTQKSPSVTLAPITYKPPPGFEIASIPSTSSDLVDLFSPSQLKGKQIWHISAAGSVSINSIKEVAAQKVQNGKSILSYKGADFGFVREAEGENAKETLLLPFSKSNDYRRADVKIARTLRLQQLVRLPGLSQRPGNLPNDATKSPPVHKRPVRQQPEGLKMRYRPFGDSETSTSESSDEAPRFRAPSMATPTKKWKGDKTNGENRDPRESSPKPGPYFTATPKSSKTSKHGKADYEERENQESVTKSKKRKHGKSSNLAQSPGNSNEQSVQPDTNANADNTLSSEKPPRRPSVARERSTKKIDKIGEIQEIPPTIDPIHKQPPKPEKPKRRDSKKTVKQIEADPTNLTPKTPKGIPSTIEKPKPLRTNDEKRRRKEEHRRRKEARESKIRHQENQPDGEIAGCEQPVPLPNGVKEIAKPPKKEPESPTKQRTLKKEPDTPIKKSLKSEFLYDEDLDMMSSDSSKGEIMRELDSWEHNQRHWGMEDNMEAYMNGDYHLIGGVYGGF